MEGDVFMAKGQSHFGNEIVRKLVAWTPAGHCRQLCGLSEESVCDYVGSHPTICSKIGAGGALE